MHAHNLQFTSANILPLKLKLPFRDILTTNFAMKQIFNLVRIQTAIKTEIISILQKVGFILNMQSCADLCSSKNDIGSLFLLVAMEH